MRLAMISLILELERELLDNFRGTQTSPSSDKRSANIKIIVEIKVNIYVLPERTFIRWGKAI